jgi:hypothetical protein
LRERFKIFLYSKKQELLAGTDGEESFSKVFGKDARIVVVLFRDTWGNTPWTRIEETAIRNRGYEEGYDFTVFIPTLPSVGMPKWVPKNRLYVGLDRWGSKGAASVIESRIQDAGGTARLESTVERAQRLKREIDAETERRKFLASYEGVVAAQGEAGHLFDELVQRATKVQQSTNWEFNVKRENAWLEIYSSFGCMAVEWSRQYANTLEGTFLDVAIWEGTPPRPGRYFISGEAPPRREHKKYTFDRNFSGAFQWLSQSGEQYSNRQMADSCIQSLMDFAHKRHMKGKN